MVPMPPKQDGQVPVLFRSSNRSITSKMTPGVASTPYWKIIANKDSSLVPEPVLSIIQLKLLPGLSVLLTSSPAARLWSASLEYVSSIPGCADMHWGVQKASDRERNEPQGERICLLAVWESSLHWAKFQDSFGLLLMREVLARDEGISNRCVQLPLPIFPGSPRSLQLASFVFDRRVSEEKRDRFTEQWRRWRDDRASEGLKVHGTWLEGDAVWPTPDLAPDRMAALERAQSELRGAQDQIFVTLIIGDESFENRIGKGPAVLEMGEHTAMLQNFSLEEQQPKLHSYFDIKSSHLPPPKTFASLLFHLPRRQYSSKTGVNHNIDQIHESTVKDFYHKTRAFPGPRGEMRVKMGDMCQYGPRYSDHALEIEESVVDIVDLGLDREHYDFGGDRQREGLMRQLFLDFRYGIREMDGCEEMYWGRDEDGRAGCIAIVYWTTPKARATNAQSLQFLKQNLIAAITAPVNWAHSPGHKTQYSNASGINTPVSIIGTTTPLSMRGKTTESIMTVTTIPSSIRTRRSSKSPRASFPLLEMTTFEIPNDRQTLDLFRRFYNAFQMTSSLNARVVTQAIPLACNTKDFFLSTPSVLSSASLSTPPSTPPNGAAKIHFTALIGWKSQSAMEEWYADFGTACQADGGHGYERLGHKIDALCSLGLENIQTRIMTMTSDAFGAKRTVMWECGDENWEAKEMMRKRKSSDRSSMNLNAQRDKRKERERRMSQLSQYSSRAS